MLTSCLEALIAWGLLVFQVKLKTGATVGLTAPRGMWCRWRWMIQASSSICYTTFRGKTGYPATSCKVSVISTHDYFQTILVEVMVHSHCTRTRPTPRQILRLIKIVPRRCHWYHWLLLTISSVSTSVSVSVSINRINLPLYFCFQLLNRTWLKVWRASLVWQARVPYWKMLKVRRYYVIFIIGPEILPMICSRALESRKVVGSR